MNETHRFCWHGVVSTDPKRAVDFYSKVLGWKAVDIRLGRGASPAFEFGGVPIAHLKQAPQGWPSHWECYLRVDNVDGRASLAEMNGGRVVLPPVELPAGRVSVVASPSGARFYLLGEFDEHLQRPAGEGAIEWVDLHSTDLEADLAWLTSAFRFETSPRTVGSYAVLNYKGQPRAGATQVYLPSLPPMWIAWITVADIEDVVARVQRHEGSVLSHRSLVGGRRQHRHRVRGVRAEGSGS
jgi:uncharacterized protein